MKTFLLPLRLGLGVVALATLAACTSPISRSTQPTGPELPPIGLAATAVWLEEREAVTPAARVRNTEVQAARVASPSGAPVTAQSVSARTVAVPDRPRPTARRARAVQAFADICVASISDVSGLLSRANAVNIRDFDEPARVRSDNSGARAFLGGIEDGPIRVLTGTNPNSADVRALCVVTTIGAGPRPTAQAKIDTVSAAGFRLDRIGSSARGEQRYRIVGAPEGTTLTVRTNVFGSGVTIAWR